MERERSHIPQKSNSFSSSSREEKLRESNRSLSLGAIRFEDKLEKETDYNKEDRIEEEKENEGKDQVEREEASKDNVEEAEPSFLVVSEEIDHFLGVLASLEDVQDPISEPPELPESNIEKFVAMLENEIATYESGEQKWSPDHDEICLLDAFNRLHKLTSALIPFSMDAKCNHAMNRTGSVLHHAMAFLEDEFFSLLDEHSRARQQDPGSTSSKTKRPPSFSRQQQQQPQQQHEQDRCILASAESNSNEDSPTYPPDVVERLRGIATAMISGGYVTECCEVFSVARHNAFHAGLSSLGCEKISIDDVQKMAWDSLEGEIATWIRAFRHSITVLFPSERELFDIVFSGHQDIANSLFSHLALGAIFQLLNFAEAVAMTKRSTEKLFKMLDIYESLRDMMPIIEAFFPVEASEEESSSSPAMDLKSEISAIESRLGEAAVAIFCDLENSIKSDTGKTPVPGGAVHPLTRYVMNYLKYACEYKNTLEQIFQDYQRSERPSSYDDDGDDAPSSSTSNHENQKSNNDANDPRPFAAQLMEVMELLHANLESKSKLYKDQALCNIFLMNNGRYIMKKIRGAAEINELLGDAWRRNRSSDLRQYHNNYRRETWSKVLECFRDGDLNVRGHVSKPVLKERFKSFNAMFDEIHKTQSSWVVSDEQLQSELRASISAVVVPAYRSFLGRYSQYLDPGRQTEKYIKFGADDLENYIDELFDGNPTSMARRRT